MEINIIVEEAKEGQVSEDPQVLISYWEYIFRTHIRKRGESRSKLDWNLFNQQKIIKMKISAVKRSPIIKQTENKKH